MRRRAQAELNAHSHVTSDWIATRETALLEAEPGYRLGGDDSPRFITLTPREHRPHVGALASCCRLRALTHRPAPHVMDAIGTRGASVPSLTVRGTRIKPNGERARREGFGICARATAQMAALSSPAELCPCPWPVFLATPKRAMSPPAVPPHQLSADTQDLSSPHTAQTRTPYRRANRQRRGT